jgi:predicted ribosome quality control (RQC) complex YloA/Tae2 family protein
MSVDFITLACFCDQLDGLLGARVQQVLLPDDRSVSLELYTGERLNLLASAQSQAPRILLTPEKSRRGVEGEPPILLLLRKWVRGGRLVDVTQPPWERIVVLHFSGHVGECQLVVELVGRYSNIILVGPDGTVLEAVKHVDPTMSRYRVTLPGHPYQLPPLPPNRRPSTGLSVSHWHTMLERIGADEPLSEWLVGHVLGVSPTAAREIAARAADDPHANVGAVTADALRRAVEELFSPLENGWWEPHVALDKDGRIIDFTPYKPRQYGRVEPVANISQAMWRYFEERGLSDPYAAARETVAGLIQKTRTRLAKRLANVAGSYIVPEEIEALRLSGELLLTYQHQVPVGSQEATLPDYDGEMRAIPLDPQLTLVENAQAYFRRYAKAQRAAKRVPPLIRQIKAEQAYLEQLDADLFFAESRPEIDAVHQALAVAGWTSTQVRSGGQISGPRRFEVEGFPIYAGRNARQNEQVTFRRAGPDDLWLHVRGLPGAHVVIKRDRRDVPKEVVQRAAELAAYYSRARESTGEIAVDMTERRFVKRVRAKYPGLVNYRNQQTLWVRLDEGSGFV